MSTPTVQPETSPSFEGVQLLDTPVKVSAPPEDEEVGETIEDVFEQEPEPDSEPKPEQEPGEEEDIAGDIESEPEGEESGEVEDDGGSKVEDAEKKPRGPSSSSKIQGRSRKSGTFAFTRGERSRRSSGKGTSSRPKRSRRRS